ncbi:transposable element Tcb1 transposase [Trichonephila clavipes]|nr:transposable element Tcb1 transposase [Trichonephila clavipes]
MDPQPRNLAQLATALESAWLNFPENTFRDLSDSLPARLAAVHSAKVISVKWNPPGRGADEEDARMGVVLVTLPGSELRESIPKKPNVTSECDVNIQLINQIRKTTINPPTGQNGFFRTTREASKMDCMDFSAFK